MANHPLNGDGLIHALASALEGRDPDPEDKSESEVDGTGFGLGLDSAPSKKVPAKDPSQGRVTKHRPGKEDPMLLGFKRVLGL